MSIQRDLTGKPVKESPKKDLFSAYGVDKESFEKSKDITPTLDLGKLEVGARVHFQFLQSEPREIEVKSKFQKGNVTTRVIKVHCYWIDRPQSSGAPLRVPMDGDYTLWLSSRSLSMSLLRIVTALETPDLKGVYADIVVGLADYKDFGENRCYTVIASR
jgi:hypothetical protein